MKSHRLMSSLTLDKFKKSYSYKGLVPGNPLYGIETPPLTESSQPTSGSGAQETRSTCQCTLRLRDTRARAVRNV